MKRTFLRTIRQKNNLTLKKLAEELGIKKQYLWQIEKGMRTPSFDLACKFQEYFGIDNCKLLKRDEETDNDI